MALNKYYITTTADTTTTIKSNATGLIFNYMFYNLGTTAATIKFYLTDSNDNDIILLKTSINAGDKLYLEEKYNLNNDDIKIYSSADDIQVLVQILTD